MSMSTRSKARLESPSMKTRSATGVPPQRTLKLVDADRENKPQTKTTANNGRKPSAKKAQLKGTKVKGTRKKKDDQVYCICKGKDDGSPMINCDGGCQNWYHFACMSIDDDEAERIERYICPDCESKTGMKTQLEGEDATPPVGEVTGVDEIEPATEQPDRKKEGEEVQAKKEEEEDKDNSEDDGSGDDYVAEVPVKRTARGTRRVSIPAEETDTESDATNTKRPKRISRGSARSKKVSKSPAPQQSTTLKRRASTAQQPDAKRSKTSDAPDHNDAVRKHCFGVLEETIQSIFVEYPFVVPDSDIDKDAEAGPSAPVVLTDDEKAAIQQKALNFTVELERCMFDTYAELDKYGRPYAHNKYKDRFRMLSFNLGKSDRVTLRKGIAHGQITPAQLNVMSSTDLANEQLKHQIEVLEKESLEHSVLQTVEAPRAKITHKGFEAIEDVAGNQRSSAALKEEEERMERERRERERLARTRIATQTQTQPSAPPAERQTASPIVPMSPTTPTSAQWGIPPSLPVHTLVDEGAALHLGRVHPRPMFIPSASDYTSMEGGLNLADLINIDDDVPPQDGPSTSQATEKQRAESVSTVSAAPEVITPSGPSPFAQSSALESPRRPSFDLASIWTGKGKPTSPVEQKTETKQAAKSSAAPDEPDKEDPMELESVDESETKDQDFDMFLERDDKDKPVEDVASEQNEAKPESFDLDALPLVWTGSIAMPNDPLEPLAPPVVARQVGGRTIPPDSGSWQMLFPSSTTQIHGRVVVDNSSQYLISMRLNSAKELIAVCFTPSTEEGTQRFNELVDYLIGKNRHALVFPWGVHPKPSSPGRELYIIPLLHERPIPEYIELLDDLHLPAKRDSNMLIGVFVLNKGKLEAATPPPVAQPPPIPPKSDIPPQFAFAQGNAPALAPSSAPIVPPATVPQFSGINPTALAAEVASLTPEQIAVMLRHLSQAAPAVPPATSAPPVPPQVPVPLPHFSPTHGYPYQQPPQIPGQHVPPVPLPNQHQSPPPPTRGDYNGYGDDYHRRPYGREERGRGSRGRGTERGRRGGYRGRGRPYNDDRDQSRYRDNDHRDGDSGWNNSGGFPAAGSSRSPPNGRRSRFSD